MHWHAENDVVYLPRFGKENIAKCGFDRDDFEIKPPGKIEVKTHLSIGRKCGHCGSRF